MITYLEKEEDFQAKIQEGLVLVDFYADWCGPCKQMGQILEHLEDVSILKVNTDLFPELAQEYQVMSIPTLLLFTNGTMKAKQIGLMSLEELTDWIQKENS